MKRNALMAVLLILLTLNTYAQNDRNLRERFPELDRILKSSTISELERSLSAGEEGINRFFTSDGGKEEHLPSIPLAEELKTAAYGIDFSVGVETVFLIPWEDVSGSIKSLEEKELSLGIYNILRSVSSLEGIEYYSASRERMRTLFAECWAVNNPDDRRKIEDPLVEAIPQSDSIFIHQKDLTFGKNISRVDYRSEGSDVLMGIVNLTTMTYMLFPIVGRENMSMQILVIPSREGILFYGLNTVKVLDLPVFYKKMESSFSNRMTALFNWFRRRIS